MRSYPTKNAPHVLAEIERVCGREVMEKVRDAFGGREVHIPTKWNPNTKLEKVIGADAAWEITKHIGWGKVMIPVERVNPRKSIVLALRKDGKSQSDIARMLGCHTGTVRRYCRILRGEGRRA